VTKTFKPMLAASKLPSVIRFPVYASFKIDGVRAMVRDSMLLSRSLKPIPNEAIQTLLGTPLLEGLDGELTVGSPTHKNLMQITTSGVMRHEGQPDFRYFVFDICNLSSEVPFSIRLEKLLSAFANTSWTSQISPRIHLLEQRFIESQEALDEFEAEALAAGYEGVICKDPAGRYKYGRSTEKEGIMFKVKRYTTSEARITGYKEEMANDNVAFINELGHTARSSHKDNKVGKGRLGAFTGVDLVTGASVSVGTGFTADQRLALWAVRDQAVQEGWIVTYKHFDHGVKDRPRHQVFIAFRDKRDM
jgi:DNA ligase-1